MQEITPTEAASLIEQETGALVLDVREAVELALATLPDSIPVLHIPMAEIPQRIDELDRDQNIIVMCRSGMRSAQVTGFLMAQGFPRVCNMRDGILGWSRDVDPGIPEY
jgi:rhodanese-related sulfurtransferase